ncbi:MAG: hypothetical protein KC713_06145, partial [Candidatus Omnitrophica bacterium]|nr:hypothetical protein [Candidatus Omnitrophota bacterium]
RHKELLTDDFFPGKAGITVQTEHVQPGYLLISRLSAEQNKNIIELMDKSTGKVWHTWSPTYEDIYHDPSVPFANDDAQSVINMRFTHPYLFEDGSLAFIAIGGRVVRVDKESKVMWQTKHHFHHAINVDHDGNLWVPAKIRPSPYKLHPIVSPLSEDYEDQKSDFEEESLVQMSPGGEILKEISVLDILLDNGLKSHIVSKWTSKFSDDPTHLNDIQPVLKDTLFAKKGDLFLSMRSNNLVLLYRPSTHKVLWHQAGPWIAQHDVTIDNDEEITVLSNDLPLDPFDKHMQSAVMTYNFKTKTVKEKYRKPIMESQFYAWSQGLQTVLPNGNVLLEETVRSRILELSFEGVEWEYINRFDQDHLGNLGWSRFLMKEQVNLEVFNK